MNNMLKILACTLIACIFSLSPVHAHRVNVFCWVDGKTVSCESSFSGGKPVKEGKISVRDGSGNTLHSGKTDKQGKFSFSAPDSDKGDIRVTVEAGLGHKGSWPIKTGEYLPESGKSPEKETQTGHEKPDNSPQKDALSRLNENKLRMIFKDTLREELAAIKKELAELKRDRITLQDVISGLGYILGLMGIALYFKSKRR